MVVRLVDQNPRREQRRQSLLLDRLTAQFDRRIRAELARAMSEMVDMFEATGEVPPARGHHDALEAIYQAMAIATVAVFGARVAQQGKSAGLIFETKDFAEIMTRLALRYVGLEAVRTRITDVASTTRNQIVSAVSGGYSEGLGQRAVAARIRAAVPTMSSLRANLIARTETHGAANYGTMEAARETGIQLSREWIASEDDRTREDHALANGQIVGMDEPFRVGNSLLMYPGDPEGEPEQTINCFPPWSLVRFAGLKAAMKREYTGDLIKMSFGGPVDLTVTPNHPVLTDKGWVAARFVVEGDKVLDAGVGDVGEVSPGLDVANGCARADDLYNAAQVSGRAVRPRGVAVNLHGEVPGHDVDIVAFKGKLRGAFYSSGLKLFADISLADTHVSKGLLLFSRMSGLGEFVAPDKADRFMRLIGTSAPLLGRCHVGGPGVALGDAGQSNPGFGEACADHRPAEVDLLGNGVHGIPLLEKGDDVATDTVPDNLPPLVGAAFKIREVASVKSFHYSGPVFNFESDTGILCTDSIVNHNCRCAVGFIVRE